MLAQEARQGSQHGELQISLEQSTGDRHIPALFTAAQRGVMRKEAKMKNLPLESHSFVPRPSLPPELIHAEFCKHRAED